MLFAPYEPLLSATTPEQLATELHKAIAHLGFKYFSGIVIFDKPGGTREKKNFENIPAAYLDSYKDPALLDTDPVMTHCRQSSLPIAWDQRTYVDADQGHVHEHMRAHGFNVGVCTTAHLPNGVHFLFGVDRPEVLPASPQEMQQLVANVQLLAVHAQEAAIRMAAATGRQVVDSPHLTPREIEVLKWTMAGKTAWETGTILNISQRTATIHITNAMRKLGAVKKHQAVIRALQLGLIS